MLSNVASASRAILSKGLMNKPIGENLDAPNLCVFHLRCYGMCPPPPPHPFPPVHPSTLATRC